VGYNPPGVQLVVDTDSAGSQGLIANVSDKLIRALPPAFLLLVLLNVVFLGVASWVFQHNTQQRNDLLNKIVESCLTGKDKP
jgi:hypothetical protein